MKGFKRILEVVQDADTQLLEVMIGSVALVITAAFAYWFRKPKTIDEIQIILNLVFTLIFYCRQLYGIYVDSTAIRHLSCTMMGFVVIFTACIIPMESQTVLRITCGHCGAILLFCSWKTDREHKLRERVLRLLNYETIKKIFDSSASGD